METITYISLLLIGHSCSFLPSPSQKTVMKFFQTSFLSMGGNKEGGTWQISVLKYSILRSLATGSSVCFPQKTQGSALLFYLISRKLLVSVHQCKVSEAQSEDWCVLCSHYPALWHSFEFKSFHTCNKAVSHLHPYAAHLKEPNWSLHMPVFSGQFPKADPVLYPTQHTALTGHRHWPREQIYLWLK